jgi:hypothetical protein
VESFEPKLREVEAASKTFERSKKELQASIDERGRTYNFWEQTHKQKMDHRDRLAERQSEIQNNMNKQPNISTGQTTTTNADGTKDTKSIFRENPAVAILKKELAETKVQISVADTEIKQSEANRPDRETPLELVGKANKAESDYGDAVSRSQLHAIVARFVGKDKRDVSPGEISAVGLYLILIPSIAAAFSSTLIAVTAVRRFKPAITNPPIQLPDEAVAHLFGPLVIAIQKEANDAVSAAMAKARKSIPESKTA